MSRIFKYPIEIFQKQTITLPRGSKVVHLGFDASSFLCLWAIVDSCRPTEENHDVYIVGTGFELGEVSSMNHLGTVADRSFIWHVFSPTLEIR